MIDFTPIARPIFEWRVRTIKDGDHRCEAVQTDVLRRLLHTARHTLVGEKYGFGAIRTYEDFAAQVSVMPYPELRPLVMRMVGGERDILWPGVTRRFAQSSGTSDGKSKYIPVTATSLRVNHYRGASDAVAYYLHNNPASRLFAGKAFILGGSFANEVEGLPRGVRVGDLSANLIEAINPVINTFFRVPSRHVALMADWNEKLPALVDASIGRDITNISGVPSWFLTVLRRVMERAGATSIHDVWPGLEVFFHGGISFAPYREQYRRITDPGRMHYVETYNASEGFFAVQDDPADPAMRLIADAGVFYELVPIDQVDSPHPEAVPLWRAEQGKVYALLITACNGLWRYPIGDTVRIESTDPVKITIAGRTKHYINAFGEELMVYNADAAIERTCRAHGCDVANYTAAPVYADGGRRGCHQWLIEWSTPPAAGVEKFAADLDDALRRENSDYDAKRTGDIFLAPLQIVTAPAGLFDRWLASTGKLGGQRKVPRLCNDRRFIDPMLAMLSGKKG